ncbi:MAG: antitoxin Xre/MbcA/ParS toxin-binding domain-containing protein [Acidobacteriota bacterium]
MDEHIDLYELLGGAGVLRDVHGQPDALVTTIREGLPYASFEYVATALASDRDTLSRVLTIPARTLQRRRKEARLQPDESDRLARLARVVGRAGRVLGDLERANRWLARPNRALDGQPPLTLLDTDLGCEQVTNLLGRIETGVYT